MDNLSASDFLLSSQAKLSPSVLAFTLISFTFSELRTKNFTWGKKGFTFTLDLNRMTSLSSVLGQKHGLNGLSVAGIYEENNFKPSSYEMASPSTY